MKLPLFSQQKLREEWLKKNPKYNPVVCIIILILYLHLDRSSCELILLMTS